MGEIFYNEVGTKHKTLNVFAAEEGGPVPVRFGNRRVGVDYIAAWIGDDLGEHT